MKAVSYATVAYNAREKALDFTSFDRAEYLKMLYQHLQLYRDLNDEIDTSEEPTDFVEQHNATLREIEKQMRILLIKRDITSLSAAIICQAYLARHELDEASYNQYVSTLSNEIKTLYTTLNECITELAYYQNFDNNYDDLTFNLVILINCIYNVVTK